MDVGGTRHLSSLQQIRTLRLPEILIPGESLLRVQGVEGLTHAGPPWVVTNAGLLPQFPEAEFPVVPEWTWQYADGGSLRVLSVWSDQLPLRVPADFLRPVRVLPAVETIRARYLAPTDSLEVLVLPEAGDVQDWSRNFPDADVLIEPAGGAPQVVELSDGERIRVRPGTHGRSVIRVWARWDTVTRSFASPKAEIVWVSPCEYTGLDLPADLAESLRDLTGKTFPEGVNVFWEPEWRKQDQPSHRPDAVRAQRMPADERWMVAEVPASRWTVWREVEGERWSRLGTTESRSPRVALPASAVAGRGRWDCPVRQDLLNGTVRGDWLELTTRDLIPRLETTTP